MRNSPHELGRSDMPGTGVDPRVACAVPPDELEQLLAALLADGHVVGNDDPRAGDPGARVIRLQLDELLDAWRGLGLGVPAQAPQHAQQVARMVNVLVAPRLRPVILQQLQRWVPFVPFVPGGGFQQWPGGGQQPPRPPVPQQGPQGRGRAVAQFAINPPDAPRAEADIKVPAPPPAPGPTETAPAPTPQTNVRAIETAQVRAMELVSAMAALFVERLERERVPCGGPDPYRWGLPAAPTDVDVLTQTTVAGPASGFAAGETLATYTVPKGHRALIEAFGVEDVLGAYSTWHFRLTVNGKVVGPWSDVSGYPPGGVQPHTMRRVHLEAAAGDVIKIEGYHGDATRDVWARLAGVVFPC